MKTLTIHISLLCMIAVSGIFCCTGSLMQPVKSLSVGGSTGHARDTKIIVFTNRVRSSEAGEHQFFGTTVDSSGKTSQVRVDFADGESKITFFDTLDSALDGINPDDDILIFVHGDGKGFVQTIEYSARLNALYGVAVIAFDWPSKDPVMPDGAANFYKSLQNAKRSVTAFDTFIRDVSGYYLTRPRKGAVTILFHSLGAMIVQRWAERTDCSIGETPIGNLILDAAAVKQKRHARWLSKINIQKRIYVTMNDEDFTLRGASMLLFNKTLGIRAMPPYAENAQYIDFSGSLGREHNYLIMDATAIGPDVRAVYDDILHGKILDTGDRGRFARNAAPNVFTLLKRN